MHELSMAEENYGFASDCSTLALGSMIAAVVFSVTIILSALVLFRILIVEEYVNLIPYFISLHCKQWVWCVNDTGTRPFYWIFLLMH